MEMRNNRMVLRRTKVELTWWRSVLPKIPTMLKRTNPAAKR
jgi:hypothetical protein